MVLKLVIRVANYDPVDPGFDEDGGGKQTTISQLFLIHGFFQLLLSASLSSFFLIL
jgi:hypothetical protein